MKCQPIQCHTSRHLSGDKLTDEPSDVCYSVFVMLSPNKTGEKISKLIQYDREAIRILIDTVYYYTINFSSVVDQVEVFIDTESDTQSNNLFNINSIQVHFLIHDTKVNGNDILLKLADIRYLIIGQIYIAPRYMDLWMNYFVLTENDDPEVQVIKNIYKEVAHETCFHRD